MMNLYSSGTFGGSRPKKKGYIYVAFFLWQALVLGSSTRQL